MRIFLFSIGLLVATGCRPAGLEHVPTEKISTVDDLSTLMWVQADTADPRFDLADDLKDDPSAMNDETARAFIDMGVRLQATGKRLEHFTMGPDFVTWAKEMTSKAATLEKAARGGDGATAVAQVLSIRETCRTCHKKYK